MDCRYHETGISQFDVISSILCLQLTKFLQAIVTRKLPCKHNAEHHAIRFPKSGKKSPGKKLIKKRIDPRREQQKEVWVVVGDIWAGLGLIMNVISQESEEERRRDRVTRQTIARYC